ncbi:MAG: FG-GAP-like repeat-containing protein, partial [Ferruginibacter sp.]
MRISLILLMGLLLNQQLLSQVPAIISFSPVSGPVGTTVTITGTNFDPGTTNNIVFFGAVRANVTSASPTSLNAIVPAGTSYQPITVTTGGLTAFSAKPFIVTFSGGGNGFAASSFAPKVDFAAGKGPSCIAAVDLDGDGKPELAAVNDTSNTLSVFKNISSAGTIAFAAKTDLNTGNMPYCVAAGDLDGDGKPDLAVVNGGSNTVSLYNNKSSGAGVISFAPKIDLTTGGFPFCVVIMDLDADGKPDLAVVNATGNTVSIFKNNSSPGSISFSPKSDFSTGASPSWIIAVDLDNDGKPDLATANGGIAANSVSVLRNVSTTGSISFAAKTDFNGGANSLSIAAGDLDTDGKADLIVSNGSQAAVSVLRSTSTGAGDISFASARFYQAGNAFGVNVNDLNGDGKLDIIIPNSQNNSISVLRNSNFPALPDFDAKQDFVTGINPWVAIAVDLDGDGKPDIATANYKSGNISVIRNSISNLAIQSFTPASAGTGTTVTINGANFIGITGVSFGGIPATSFSVLSNINISAVVATGGSGNVTVTTNAATASLAGFVYLPAPTITAFSPFIAGTGDTITITGTGFTSVNAISFGSVQAASFTLVSPTKITAVVAAGASGNIAVTSLGGTALLAGFVYVPPPVVTAFMPVNADTGSIVTITGNYFTGATTLKIGEKLARSFTVISPTSIQAVVDSFSGGSVSVITPFGTGKLGGFYNGPIITSFAPGFGPVGTAVTINGANFSNNPANNIVYFGAVQALITNASNTSLTVIVPPGTTYQPFSVTCNHLVSYSDKPFVQTFFNNDSLVTTNSFTPKIDFASGNNSEKSAVGDLNGDGKPDLVVPNTDFVTVFKNTGGNGIISFTKTDLPFSNALMLSVSISDLDADGKPDIIGLDNSPTISIAKNTGDNGIISFSSPLHIPLADASIYRLAINDIDGDGKPDIVVTQVVNGKVLIFRNITNNGIISFDSPISYAAGYDPQAAYLADLDGDNKPDLVVSSTNSTKLFIYRNVSKSGDIAFDYPFDVVCPVGLGSIVVSDFDGDDKLDIAVSNTIDSSVIIYRNISSYGNISFKTPLRFLAGINPYDLVVQDLDGDGKTDIAAVSIISGNVNVLKNTSSYGNLSFAPKVAFSTGLDPVSVLSGDFDGDGKADLAVANFHSDSFSIYRNRMAESTPIVLCPPVAIGAFSANITGTVYQWQVNTGNGFSDIINSSNYIGANAVTLQLSNIPSSWNG